jgi:hypothetical protein
VKAAPSFLTPHPDTGEVAHGGAALKKFGIGTRVSRRMDWKDIRATIDEGFPMLIGTGKEDPHVQGDHWSTLYGYGTHNRRAFPGNPPGVLRNQTSVDWGEFLAEWWNPKGKAIICWGK